MTALLRDGRVRRLVQHPPQIFIAFRRPTAVVLFGTFLLAGTGSHPRGQLRRRGERTGLDAHFRDDLLRRIYSQSGYFRQSLSLDGWQVEHYPVIDPSGLPLRQLTDAGGAPVLLEVPMPGQRVLRARVWQAEIGRIPLLLMDSDIDENDDDSD